MATDSRKSDSSNEQTVSDCRGDSVLRMEVGDVLELLQVLQSVAMK